MSWYIGSAWWPPGEKRSADCRLLSGRRRRRRRRRKASSAMMARAATPPTTPPAIAPTGVLEPSESEGLGVVLPAAAEASWAPTPEVDVLKVSFVAELLAEPPLTVEVITTIDAGELLEPDAVRTLVTTWTEVLGEDAEEEGDGGNVK